MPSIMMKRHRSFERAADLDPKLAMAYWGVAEAVGPNYNDPADRHASRRHTMPSRKRSIFRPARLANEQAYIQAMAMRFPADPNADRRKAAEDYRMMPCAKW